MQVEISIQVFLIKIKKANIFKPWFAAVTSNQISLSHLLVANLPTLFHLFRLIYRNFISDFVASEGEFVMTE